MTKVCVIASDPIYPQMAGPAIRSLELARGLSKKFDVTFTTPNEADHLGEEPFTWKPYDFHSLKEIVADQDVVCVFGFQLRLYPYLKKISAALVVDIYCPTFFEALSNHSHFDLDAQVPFCRSLIDIFTEQLLAGDFFICASEPQRDMWVGMLMNAGRINPYTYANDNTLRSLIDVVPYGLPKELPKKQQSSLKGIHPAIKPNDLVLLWGGGVYDWLDPVTGVKAMEIVCKKRQDVKLFFMGCQHPQSNVIMEELVKTRELSKDLDLTGKNVLFNDYWVPYDARTDYLLEADIGLNLHKKSIETDYSFRTRIMDYIWCELPILTTRGGALSNLVEDKQLGVSVDYNDPEGLAEAILEIAEGKYDLEQYRANLREIRSQYTWDRAIEPLVKFCQSPHKDIDSHFAVEIWSVRSPTYYYKVLSAVMRSKGMKGVVAKVLLFILNKANVLLARSIGSLAQIINKKTD